MSLVLDHSIFLSLLPGSSTIKSRFYDAGIKGFVEKETKIPVIVSSCPSPFIVEHTFTDLALTHPLLISLPSLLSSKLPTPPTARTVLTRATFQSLCDRCVSSPIKEAESSHRETGDFDHYPAPDTPGGVRHKIRPDYSKTPGNLDILAKRKIRTCQIIVYNNHMITNVNYCYIPIPPQCFQSFGLTTFT